MAERKERTTVLLTKEEMSKLTNAAKEAGLSLASYTRSRALEAADQENNKRAQWLANQHERNRA